MRPARGRALPSEDQAPAHPADRLSLREYQVQALFSLGLTAGGIAGCLGLSPRTVDIHRARILAKLGAPNTAAAVGLAFRRGLV